VKIKEIGGKIRKKAGKKIGWKIKEIGGKM